MFGGDDDFGDKPSNNSKQQYGRNQQYGRGNQNSTINNSSNVQASNKQPGILKFNDDSDSDDDNNNLILGNKPNLNNNSSSNQTGFSTKTTFSNAGYSNAEDRPQTSSKQSVIDRQRDILLNKQQAAFTGTSSMTFNKKPGAGFTYGQNTDGIDFDKLQTIVNNSSVNNNQYVPGEFNAKGSGLAPVSKMNNIVKFNEKDNEIKNNNIINIDDSDEDERENIIDKLNKKGESQPLQQNTEQSSNVQNSSTKPAESQKEEGAGNNAARAQADQLLKNLYGDSSEDSEKEDEEAAHKKKLEEQKNNKSEVIGDEDDEANQAQQAVGIVNHPVTQQQNEQIQQNIAQNKSPTSVYIAENIEIFDMKQFLTRPIPKGMIIQTQIRRDKSGFARFYPKYHVHLSSGMRYLLTGKKRSNNKTSNYLMSMSKTELSRKSPHFLGKVRSNFLGTEFHIYDTGENPKKCKNLENARKELAGVIYESNLLGARGPRKMKVLIPDLQPNGDPITIRPTSNKEGIFPMFKTGRRDGLLLFQNKPPKWNDSVQAFVLNFNGRVDRPSVKNFQLIDDQNDEMILLQFGRVGDDAFNMDVMHPLSLVQAFGICLSSFDYKIACE
ncbi:Tub family protein (macronuclear) [Tetrahymena thermophila SB210]|uniref:Tub family protein n=1 Tax=Tetrahymena thermophila (strain SB210) TaxID=312017 RepID=Q22Y91_TETTS|nr:Tub family protein [Tetrahymena thermophila SB210]EAR90133.1 Tub family protein [Tetrahymena thermophila SB210]|eukprot:XP_001010378.1 Tub family protein [Tetrahymena thermophila SB210]